VSKNDCGINSRRVARLHDVGDFVVADNALPRPASAKQNRCANA